MAVAFTPNNITSEPRNHAFLFYSGHGSRNAKNINFRAHDILVFCRGAGRGDSEYKFLLAACSVARLLSFVDIHYGQVLFSRFCLPRYLSCYPCNPVNREETVSGYSGYRSGEFFPQ
jgi:hypothetical protein